VQIRILLTVSFVVGLIVFTGCDSSKPKAVGSQENLTISTYPGDYSALLWIAKDRRYFSEQGVKVKLETQDSGVAALRDLLAGKVDLALVSEFAFVSHIVQRPDVRILTVVSQMDNTKLVARKDHGITQVSDLRNKRIGLVLGSNSEYYLHRLLMIEQIPAQDVQKVDLGPSEQVKAIAQGKIDAAVVWEPFDREIQKELGNNSISWSAQSGQPFYGVIVGTEDTLKRRSAAIRGVLTALVSAEDFIKNNRDEAKRIVASQIASNHTPELWKTAGFRLTLSRPIILAMESELRWMNSEQGVEKFKMPDLLDFIHFDALNSVSPEKIQMLH